MTRLNWPPWARRSPSAAFMMIVAATGYRRWLSRPGQWTLRDHTAVVIGCAAALAVSRLPSPMIVFVSVLAGAVLLSLSLARHGFRLIDVAALVAIVLLCAAILLPAMERTRQRTLGKRLFPSAVPAHYRHLVDGTD